MKKGGMRKFTVAMAVGLAMGAGVFAGRGGFAMTAWPDIAVVLCDACFVPAALMLCVGLLLFATNDGFFDMLTYGVQKALRSMLSAEKRAGYPKTFYDYRVSRQGKKAGFGFLLCAGGIYLALAAVFLLLGGI